MDFIKLTISYIIVISIILSIIFFNGWFLAFILSYSYSFVFLIVTLIKSIKNNDKRKGCLSIRYLILLIVTFPIVMKLAEFCSNIKLL